MAHVHLRQVQRYDTPIPVMIIFIISAVFQKVVTLNAGRKAEGVSVGRRLGVTSPSSQRPMTQVTQACPCRVANLLKLETSANQAIGHTATCYNLRTILGATGEVVEGNMIIDLCLC